MHQFLDEHTDSTRGLRFWSDNYVPIDPAAKHQIESRPLYAVATCAHPDQA